MTRISSLINRPILLTEDEFDKRYPLLVNHLDPDATWAFGQDRGCLFGFSQPEIEFVLARDPRTVWTLINNDAGDPMLISGVHLVNRIGYLVSTVARSESLIVEVQLETDGENA
jgi:hypothetical protein